MSLETLTETIDFENENTRHSYKFALRKLDELLRDLLGEDVDPLEWLEKADDEEVLEIAKALRLRLTRLVEEDELGYEMGRLCWYTFSKALSALGRRPELIMAVKALGSPASPIIDEKDAEEIFRFVDELEEWAVIRKDPTWWAPFRVVAESGASLMDVVRMRWGDVCPGEDWMNDTPERPYIRIRKFNEEVTYPITEKGLEALRILAKWAEVDPTDEENADRPVLLAPDDNYMFEAQRVDSWRARLTYRWRVAQRELLGETRWRVRDLTRAARAYKLPELILSQGAPIGR